MGFGRCDFTKIDLRPVVAWAIAASVLMGCTANVGSVRTDREPEPDPPEFDPANFVDPTTSTNPYHPLRPGIQWVRGGTTEVGHRKVPHQVISTMTDVIRIIDGVPSIAMLDQSTDSGEICQVGFDYFALDKDGNVWLMGGYAEDFEGGEYTNVETAWLGTAGGGIPGILVPGVVTRTTPRWYISTSGDEAPSGAEPVAVGIDVAVAFGGFQNVVAILEGFLGAIDNEIKYYAPGVGVVLNEPQNRSLHQDHFELLNMFQLSPEGLAEVSQVVLNMEEHARETAPEVYGSAPSARRARG